MEGRGRGEGGREGRGGPPTDRRQVSKGSDRGGDPRRRAADVQRPGLALITFISLTGLILIYYIHKHRLAGVILLVVGAALASLVYVLYVP